MNDDGPDSLRAAITQADLDTAPDTIQFAPAVTGTITLSSALPDLSTNITLDGPGASVLTVARSTVPGTSGFRIFTVTAGAEVTISGLTITGGQADSGGGIANSGTLTLTNSTLNNNSAGDISKGSGFGGGIFNSGTVTVTSSTFSANSVGIAGGGGIYNHGTVTVSDSILSGNTVTISGAIFSDFGGGGIDNFGGMVTVTGSTLSGNSAGNGGGGIVNRAGTVTVTNSTLSGNSAGDRGGGMENSEGMVTVTNSTLSGNSARNGGGIYSGFIANSAPPPASVTASTSIFANPSGGNLTLGENGAFVSRGHNLFSDAPAVTLDPTDLINTDPRLGPLARSCGRRCGARG